GDLRLLVVDVGRKLTGQTLVQRNLTSPAVSPDGRWIVYVPVQRYVQRVGPGFAARAAERLEALRIDRPNDPPQPLDFDLPGLTGQPAFSVDGKHLYVTQFLNDSNGDGEIDASDHGVLFRVPFDSARDDAPARASSAWAEQLTESTWNCQYPSPSATLLVTTCTRMGGGGLDIFSLPATGQVPEWSTERLALEVELSARRSEQTILYRHLLDKTTTVTGRRQLMMRLLRLHLASDEFDAADFYAKKIKAVPDPQTAGVASALRVWIEQRRAERARERGRMAAEFVSESRARLASLDLTKTKMPAAIALKRIVRSEIADSLGDKELARAELDAAPIDEVPLSSVLEAYYERADALYRELDDRDALATAARRLSEHAALPLDLRLRYARAAVRALVRGLPYDETDALLAHTEAPADSELAFAVELGRAVNAIRVEEPPKSVRETLVALYKKQKRHDRQRAVVLDAVQRASRLEAEKLVEALAQLYVDDVPKGTQERRRAERLFERVMLSRAYRRLGKGHFDKAKEAFLAVATTTGSLEAHIGYVDLRLKEGATPAQLRDEYVKRTGNADSPVSEFVRAYLLARELPSLSGDARERAIDDVIAGLKRAAPQLRGKPEPQVVWGAVLHERYLDDGALASAQKANLHYLLALELVPRNPRYRSHILSELALLQSEVGNWRIALSYLQERDKLPLADDAGGVEHRL
ncbi:MAG: TolB family protein, partial [Polyangia bacterium]